MTDTKSHKILEKFKLLKKDYYLIVGRLIPDNNPSLLLKVF